MDYAASNVIDIPRKVCLPKVQSRYECEETYNDVDEGNLIFTQYGNAVFRCKDWIPGTRKDIIEFDRATHQNMFDKLKISQNISSDVKEVLHSLIRSYWDCFDKEGIKRHILGFEFSIDTGRHTPVCCKKPRYGPHESKIIMKQIKTLLSNKWIRKCPTGG